MHRLTLVYKAIRELGPGKLGLFARYQAGLRSGLLRRLTATPSRSQPEWLSFRSDLLSLPARQEGTASLDAEISGLLAEADEILSGNVRLFGGSPVPLSLVPVGNLEHWTRLEGQSWSDINLMPQNGDHLAYERQDIKYSWEAARFGWVFILGRAFHINQNECYAQAFWNYLDSFLLGNPPYRGSNWVSAQEAGLRIIALVFAGQVFAGWPGTPVEGMQRLAESVAKHAQRIPPTLSYARAQNNNHLLSEAVGLYTAGLFLPDHPRSPEWRRLGWHWFHTGLQAQISPLGEYVQQSTNYHRLMLQLAAWMVALWSGQNDAPVFPPASLSRLQAASRWLLALYDEQSGCVPNLGANDGANILPLAACSFKDYRPVLQMTALFTGEKPVTEGPWDEPLLWLQEARVARKLALSDRKLAKASMANSEPGLEVLHLPGNHSWAYLRWVHFRARPAHADQLHLDMWWHGQNLTLDAGTYLYNAPPPWDNTLARTAVHNTLEVNHQDQMTRGGRFLYLDWAQATLVDRHETTDGSSLRCVAQHDGYRHLGLIHQRAVTVLISDRWLVEDRLLPLRDYRVVRGDPLFVRLHWLLPDWPWELVDCSLALLSPHGRVDLEISLGSSAQLEELRLSRAGELLSGRGPAEPAAGWYSPTYGVKLPALSLDIMVSAHLPMNLTSVWNLPTPSDQKAG